MTYQELEERYEQLQEDIQALRQDLKDLVAEMNSREAERTAKEKYDKMSPEEKAALTQIVSPVGVSSKSKVGKIQAGN